MLPPDSLDYLNKRTQFDRIREAKRQYILLITAEYI